MQASVSQTQSVTLLSNRIGQCGILNSHTESLFKEVIIYYNMEQNLFQADHFGVITFSNERVLVEYDLFSVHAIKWGFINECNEEESLLLRVWYNSDSNSDNCSSHQVGYLWCLLGWACWR